MYSMRPLAATPNWFLAARPALIGDWGGDLGGRQVVCSPAPWG
jgi:hypothetical protein